MPRYKTFDPERAGRVSGPGGFPLDLPPLADDNLGEVLRVLRDTYFLIRTKTEPPLRPAERDYRGRLLPRRHLHGS